MSANPQRIQLRRRKGWRMPENTVNVARPSKWGNPFTVPKYGRELAVESFRNMVISLLAVRAVDLTPLRGKNLACWCKLGEKCHADVLLELANDR